MTDSQQAMTLTRQPRQFASILQFHATLIRVGDFETATRIWRKVRANRANPEYNVPCLTIPTRHLEAAYDCGLCVANSRWGLIRWTV